MLHEFFQNKYDWFVAHDQKQKNIYIYIFVYIDSNENKNVL